jgi:fatty-acyl-CoA synthase
MRLAGAVAPLAHGRPAAVLAPNTHALLEAHYGVPWAGVPLVAINTRLSAGEMAYILEHSEAAVLVHDPAFDELVDAVAAQMSNPPQRIRAGAGDGGEYESMLAAPSAVHLWTLPMFHCNGWCFPWAVTAAAATHVCLPKVDAAEVWRLIRQEGVTHLNGAPTVLSMIAYAKEAAGGTPHDRVVQIATGGAPPSPAILRRMTDLGFEVMHLYGLTEAFGPTMLCDWRPEWDGLDADAQARLKARQGVGNMITFTPRVIAEDGSDVPADGSTTGQVALRGNNVMLGYFKDPEATAAAAPDGWFRTGDIGVVHPDGYVEIRDRSKDVIISGGENIASVEIEQAIMDHPAVLEAAVIAVPDERWGEVPAAYVTLQDGASVTEAEIIDHVKKRLARFKAPQTVTFGDLPKTATGKIQKFVLRNKAWAGVQRGAQ